MEKLKLEEQRLKYEQEKVKKIELDQHVKKIK